jgi:uncharacterized Zn finger protein
MSFWSFSKHVRKAEKKAKSEKKLAQLKKKQDVRPVIIEGSVIARTWWGKAWNKNLESYADYTNRIGRGRSYVRCGAVLDLQVNAGEIKALVQGSRAKPYSVTIAIKKLNRNTWKMIASACAGKLESLEELLTGKFPRALEETFMQRNTGLFPSPREIEFDCSCPDWASMCKHVAATLYGIGARLDEDPTLFFTLRGVDTGDLVKRTVSSKAEDLLKKASRTSPRIIEGADLSADFGIDLVEEVCSATSHDTAVTKMAGEQRARMADVRKALKKQVKMDARFPRKKKPSEKGSAKKKVVKGNAKGIVENIVRK